MHLEFAYFYFVLIHLELKRNHTRYQTKMSKIDTRFRTKKVCLLNVFNFNKTGPSYKLSLTVASHL